MVIQLNSDGGGLQHPEHPLIPTADNKTALSNILYIYIIMFYILFIENQERVDSSKVPSKHDRQKVVMLSNKISCTCGTYSKGQLTLFMT